MTKSEFRESLPDGFTVVETSREYAIKCSQCFRLGYTKPWREWYKSVIKAEKTGTFLQLQAHDHLKWHEEHPEKTYEDERREVLDRANKQAMQELNRVFSRLFR